MHIFSFIEECNADASRAMSHPSSLLLSFRNCLRYLSPKCFKEQRQTREPGGSRERKKQLPQETQISPPASILEQWENTCKWFMGHTNTTIYCIMLTTKQLRTTDPGQKSCYLNLLFCKQQTISLGTRLSISFDLQVLTPRQAGTQTDAINPTHWHEGSLNLHNA